MDYPQKPKTFSECLVYLSKVNTYVNKHVRANRINLCVIVHKQDSQNACNIKHNSKYTVAVLQYSPRCSTTYLFCLRNLWTIEDTPVLPTLACTRPVWATVRPRLKNTVYIFHWGRVCVLGLFYLFLCFSSLPFSTQPYSSSSQLLTLFISLLFFRCQKL